MLPASEEANGANGPICLPALVRTQATIVASRRFIRLPLDGRLIHCNPAFRTWHAQTCIRLLQRYGISNLPDGKGRKALKELKQYPNRLLHIDIAECEWHKVSLTCSSRSAGTSKFAYVELLHDEVGHLPRSSCAA